MADITDGRLRALFADERRAFIEVIQTHTAALMRGMHDANKPLERDLRELRTDFKALAMTVGEHEARLATGDAVFDAIKASIGELSNRDRLDQRQQLRRAEDIAREIAATMVAQATEKAAAEKVDTGENRRLTMHDVYVVVGTATGTGTLVFGLLKLLGKL